MLQSCRHLHDIVLISVVVCSTFMQGNSTLNKNSYVWSYKIRITNTTPDRTVTLQSRHWVILHDDGHREEVR